MNPTYRQLIRSGVLGTLALIAMVFIPAGTLNYWQGWAYLVVAIFVSALYTIYLVKYDPALLQRRQQAARRTKKSPRKKSLSYLFLRPSSRSSFYPRSTIASAGRPYRGTFRSLAMRSSRSPSIFSISCRRSIPMRPPTCAWKKASELLIPVCTVLCVIRCISARFF